MIDWIWLPYDALSRDQLFEIIYVRQAVFVVEQDCAYQDADRWDAISWHLFTCDPAPPRHVIAYARVVPPGHRFAEPSIGRVLTAPSARRSGLGRELMSKAIAQTATLYPQTAIRISAQQYLEPFYTEFGFRTVSEPYAEDGIPHVEMLRNG